MSAAHDIDPRELERLRAAFVSLGDDAVPGDDALDPETIWKAARGELSPEETAAVVDRAARCPVTAESWRLARAVGEAAEAGEDAEPARSRSDDPDDELAARRARRTPVRHMRRLASAGLALAAAAALALWLGRHPGAPEVPAFRGGESPIRAVTGHREALPAGAFILRWEPVGEGARYRVWVATEALETLARSGLITATSYRVPAEALAGQPAGAVILWRVEAELAGGGTIRSLTFTATVK